MATHLKMDSHSSHLKILQDTIAHVPVQWQSYSSFAHSFSSHFLDDEREKCPIGSGYRSCCRSVLLRQWSRFSPLGIFQCVVCAFSLWSHFGFSPLCVFTVKSVCRRQWSRFRQIFDRDQIDPPPSS